MKHVYSDTDLTAYLDGTLPPETISAIEAAAKGNADLQDRITEMTVDLDTLNTAFKPLLGVAETRNLQHKLECASNQVAANQSRPPKYLLKIASYAATIVLGLSLGWQLFTPTTNWRTEVAHYQALYVAETLGPVVPDSDRIQAEFKRASDALGLSLDPEAFSQIDGLQLRRAQVLEYNGTPLIQIAFTMPDGTPVAFCILPKSGQNTDQSTTTLVGLAAATWDTETHSFLTIGGTDTKAILAFSKQLQQQI